MQKYGCLFCRSGFEERIAEWIRMRYRDYTVIVPQKLKHRRMGGQLFTEKDLLFPGYLFFQTDEKQNPFTTKAVPGVYSVLHNDMNDWRLRGADEQIAEKLFAEDGCIGFSKAYFVNDRIHIEDGFLKGLDGNIIHVNRKSRTAQVEIILNQRKITAWIGYEQIQPLSPAE